MPDQNTRRNFLKFLSLVKPEGNAIILDSSSTMLTQVYGIDYTFV